MPLYVRSISSINRIYNGDDADLGVRALPGHDEEVRHSEMATGIRVWGYTAAKSGAMELWRWWYHHTKRRAGWKILPMPLQPGRAPKRRRSG